MTNEFTRYRDIQAPIGPVRVACRGARVVAIYLGNQLEIPANGDWRCDPSLETPALAQLGEYFAGARREFDFRFYLEGTPFQERVWRTLATIPFGETISYAELARRVDRPTAVRAVGGANARNPLSIVLPCHRVVGSDGRLTGYAGGVEYKRLLLDFERRALGRDPAHPIQQDLLTSGGLSA